MTTQAWLTIAILAVTFVLLIRSRIPPVAVFVGALTLTIAFDLAPLEKSLRGFSNSGMLTVGVLLMVAAGMYRTGAITVLSEMIVGRPRSLLTAQLRILPPVAFGSAFLNNTPLVAMFIPVIRDLARTTGLSATRLYIPLSYASILGGTCTLIGTSTNLVIAGMVIDLLDRNEFGAGFLRELGMFDPAWVGLPATVIGILFLVVFSRFLLPESRGDTAASEAKRWYRGEFELAVGGPLIGRSLGQVGWLTIEGCQLVSMQRSDGSEVEPASTVQLRSGDQIAFAADLSTLVLLWATEGLEPSRRGHPMQSERFTHRLVEVVIAPQSEVVGRRLAEIPIEGSPYNINVVAIARDGLPLPEAMSTAVIEAGDVALLEVDEAFFGINSTENNFSMTRRVTGARIKRYERAMAASVITTAMVVVVALGWFPMLTAALLATGAMLLTGCLTPRAAGRAVQWSTLVIIASAIGLEAAVTGSGLTDSIAGALNALGGGDPRLALVALFLGCTLMNTMITNVASAVFLFPIAVEMATTLGVSAMPLTMTVLIGASCSFISPMSYQTNLMVYGPGGYRFTDFVRIGIPLTVVIGAITVFLAPLIWPF